MLKIKQIFLKIEKKIEAKFDDKNKNNISKIQHHSN